eukprot:gene16782-19959_t
MIQQRYDEAIQANDAAQVLRFCKLYMLLERVDEGMIKYCAFLKKETAAALDPTIQAYQASVTPGRKKEPAAAGQQPVGAVGVLTKVFQHFASLIEDHLEVVLREFGLGHCPAFLMAATKLCDSMAAKVFATFSEQFQLARAVSDVVATRDQPRDQQQRDGSGSGGQKQSHLDPRNFAPVLDEIVMMSKSTRFYERYLGNKEKTIKEDIRKSLATAESMAADELKDDNSEQATVNPATIKLLESINLKTTMYSTNTKQKMNEVLGNYLLLEEYFMTESTNKAVQLDEHSEDSLTSSMVDFIFFVLQKSLQRSIDSHHIQSFNVISSRLIRILIQTQDVLQKMFREQIVKSTSKVNIDYKDSMIVLNNIETSGEYILKLKKEMAVRCERIFTSAEEKDQVALQATEYQGCSKSYTRLLQEEIDAIFKSIQPRLKHVLFLYTNINYELGQEEYDNNDVNDPFVFPFTLEITQFLKPFEEHLTPTNYDLIVHHTIVFLLKKIENGIYTKRFTLLGALQFGKDIRAISTFFSKISQSTVRDKFSKLNQIVSFLTLERMSEVTEFWSENSSMSSWKISPTEVKKILSSRVDFSQDLISKLKL